MDLSYNENKIMRQTLLFIILIQTSCQTPRAVEKAGPKTSAYLNLKTKFRVRSHLFVGKYLWLFSDKEILVYNGKTTQHILFKDLPIPPCNLKPLKHNPQLAVKYFYDNPNCRAFPDWFFSNYGRELGRFIQRTRVENEKLIITLNRNVIYTFNADGTLEGFKKGDFLKSSPYSKMGWSEKDGKLFYKNKAIANQPWRFHFSGDWLLIFKKETHHFILYDVGTGTKKAVFHKTTREEYKSSYDRGFVFDEGEGGFYLYRNRRPFRWFGKRILLLNSDKGKFCYVYKGEKKCIDDPENELKRVTENDYYRTYVGKWIDTYIEVKK